MLPIAPNTDIAKVAIIMQKCVFAVLGLLSLVAYPTLSLAQNNPFTVADSIQMIQFNQPSGNTFKTPVWTISPDGATVLLVTTRGIVAANVVESTLWTLDLRATAKYLEKGSADSPPSLKQLFTVRGQLRADQGDSYGSLITQCRWSVDSRFIYMLLEQKGGRRDLDRVDVTTGLREPLSQEGYSVGIYAIDSRGVLYSADQPQEDAGPAGTNTLDVVDTVRGTSVWQLLWHPLQTKRLLFRSDSSGMRPIAPAPNRAPYDTFSISPDGSKVITLVPVVKALITWKPYSPADSTQPLYRSVSADSPVLEYEVVDLNTNSRRPLLGSPSGVQAAYYDQAKVVWSPEGDHALVTNTFLPFDHQTQKEQEVRQRPCAAAYVDVHDGSATCIVLARSSETKESADSWGLSDINFGKTHHDVIIHFSWRGRLKTECYSMTGSMWSQNPTNVCDASVATVDMVNRAPVRLELLQSLDEPPSLWAEDVKNSRRVQIWNPNPQIAGKVSGTTSVYRWLDKDKRQWIGELILPQGYKPGVRYPLVIQTHGFRPNEFLADGVWTTAMAARPLAAAGFAVLQIEDKHEQTETMEEAKIHVNGYLAAVDQLAESGLIDRKRVGIIGFSRTCWFVEETLLEWPDRFAAAVLADGVDESYLQYLLAAPELPTESDRINGGKPIGRGLETWLKSAPGFRLSELKTPLRLQAIGQISLLGEWEIYSSLRIQNKPVDMLYLPLGQHVLQNPAELMASEQGDVDWFRYWLKGEVDPDPAKTKQYERWSKMRNKGAK
jgi:dipeptidyl aminopeptidase/acylaminoacyl peptidase